MADDLHHVPVGKLLCYARAAFDFEECVRHGGNVHQCAERFREAIEHCKAPDAAGASGSTGGGSTGGGSGTGGGGSTGGAGVSGTAGGGSVSGSAGGGGTGGQNS